MQALTIRASGSEVITIDMRRWSTTSRLFWRSLSSPSVCCGHALWRTIMEQTPRTTPSSRRADNIPRSAFELCFSPLFRACGLPPTNDWPDHHRGLLTPLISLTFCFGRFQLCALGDAVIQRRLTMHVTEWIEDRHLIVSPNVVRQLVAVLHNHFTCRWHGERLGLNRLAAAASATSVDAAMAPAAGGDAPTSFTLEPSLLTCRADVVGPSDEELVMTSIGISPHRFGRSTIALEFTHFIGAVHMALGAQRAFEVIDTLWHLPLTEQMGQRAPTTAASGGPVHEDLPSLDDDMKQVVGAADESLPAYAVALLAVCLRHFPAANVAKAILAAQGITAQFTARSVASPVETFAAAEGPRRADGGVWHEEATRQNSGGSAVAVSNETAAGVAEDNTSPAWGPGGFDAVARWLQRNGSPSALDVAARMGPGEGWLTAAESTPHEQRTIVVPHHVFFADAYGTPAPVEGRITSPAAKFGPVRDPETHLSRNFGKEGIPFETNGLTATAFVRSFSEPHARTFEVSFAAIFPFSQELSTAVAPRYTEGRTRAAEVYLAKVVDDVAKLQQQS